MAWRFYIDISDWSYIIADGKRGKKISKNLRLLSADGLELATRSNLVVLGRSLGKFFAADFKQIHYISVVTFNVECSVFSAYSFADHVVLSKCACFVANQKLYAA